MWYLEHRGGLRAIIRSSQTAQPLIPVFWGGRDALYLKITRWFWSQGSRIGPVWEAATLIWTRVSKDRLRMLGAICGHRCIPWAQRSLYFACWYPFCPPYVSLALVWRESARLHFLPFTRNQATDFAFPGAAKPAAKPTVSSALMVIASAPLFHHRLGCAGGAKWHIAHKTYLLPADFRVLEERPWPGIKIVWSNKQEAGHCGIFMSTYKYIDYCFFDSCFAPVKYSML